MKEASKTSGKNEQARNNRKTKKYLTMILEGKLQDPPPALKQKLSADLGLDIQEKE
jgi:hypothetical protein